MKPKKKKAGKPNLNGFATVSESQQLILANEAFFGAVHRSGMCHHCLPAKLIGDSIRHLARGKPLVFAHIGDEFIVCDPRTYAQMVGKTSSSSES